MGAHLIQKPQLIETIEEQTWLIQDDDSTWPNDNFVTAAELIDTVVNPQEDDFLLSPSEDEEEQQVEPLELDFEIEIESIDLHCPNTWGYLVPCDCEFCVAMGWNDDEDNMPTIFEGEGGEDNILCEGECFFCNTYGWHHDDVFTEFDNLKLNSSE